MKTLIIKTALDWMVVYCGETGFIEHDLLGGTMTKGSPDQQAVTAVCVPVAGGDPYLKLANLHGEMCPPGHAVLDWCGLAK
jgi:hypothetical protein